MKVIFLLLGLFLCSCANTNQVWVLKKTETALMDYVAIVPLQEPDNKVVAKLYGSYLDRKYEVPVERDYLNIMVKKLLAGPDNELSIQEGVLVIRNNAGGKIRIGADFTDSSYGPVSSDIRGGVFLGQPEKEHGGLISTIFSWIL